MGWTFYSPTHFCKDGQINRKRECDGYFLEGANQGFYDVLKSTMKGSVYYAAVKPLMRLKKDINDNYIKEAIPICEQKVFGIVMLTAIDKTMFGIKDMDETMGPCYYDCPNSILDLLSQTNNEYAINWRNQCRENNKKPSLGKLPIGTTIKYKQGDNWVFLTKCAPAYQFKTPFWMHDASCCYVKKKNIPKNFIVVEEG